MIATPYERQDLSLSRLGWGILVILPLLSLLEGCSVFDDVAQMSGHGGGGEGGRTTTMDGGNIPSDSQSATGGREENQSGAGASGSGGKDEDSGVPDGSRPGSGGAGTAGKGGKGGMGGTGGAGGTGGTSVRCAESGSLIWSKNGHCYFAMNAQSWNVSRDNCRNVGANLVTISSESEQLFVNSLIGTGPSHWIGLFVSGSSNFSWVIGAEAVTYTNWETSTPEPSVESGVIVQANTFKWIDKPQSELHPSICERQ